MSDSATTSTPGRDPVKLTRLPRALRCFADDEREPAQVTDGGPWRGPTTAAWLGRFTSPDKAVLPWP